MPNIVESRRRFKSRMDAKQDIWRAIPALMGDGNGTIEVPNQPGYVYIRVGDEDLGQAFNNRCPLADNLAIFVGYDPITDPDRRIFQVLSVRMVDYASAGNTNIYPNVAPHHLTHEYGGGDDVFVSWRRLMGLRVGRPALFVVTVDPGYIYRAGAWMEIVSTDVDLTATHAALVGLQAQYVLISLSSVGVVTQTNGVPVASPALLTIADCPTPPANHIPLAAVRLYVMQSSIGDTPSAPDIIDLRFPTFNTMSGYVTPHNVLSASHGDSLAAAVVRGDVIYGNATPAWARLALGGISGSVLTRNAIDVLWSGYALAGTAGQTYTFPAVSGSIALGAGALTVATINDATIAAHTHAITSSSAPGAAASILASDAAGSLALVGVTTLGGNINTTQLIVKANAGQTNANPLIILKDSAAATLMPIHSDSPTNVFIGLNTGAANTIGAWPEGLYNVFIGRIAGAANTSGYWNTAIGAQSFAANTSGHENTAIGYGALGANTLGVNNIAIGVGAMYGNTEGDANFGIGSGALYTNTTGDGNMAIGVNALRKLATGTDNVAIGQSALGFKDGGDQNVAIGTYAAYGDATAAYGNVAVGYHAGIALTGANYNTILGWYTGTALTSADNCIVIGQNITPISNTADGQMTIGNLIFGIGIDGTGTTISTGKVGIGTNAPGTRFHVAEVNVGAGITGLVTLTALGSGANGDGGSILMQGKSSTTAAQDMARLDHLWTDATHASRTALVRGQTTGNATNTGYFGHWNYSAVADTAITVIPNAAGDVTELLTCLYAVAEVTGTDTGGGVAVLALSESYNICSDGTNILTLAVAADGSVTVQRTAGTDTYKVSLWMTWI